MNFLKWVVALGIVTLPLYLFPSGGPQVSHLIFLLLFLFFIYMSKTYFDNTIFTLMLFLFFIFIRESVSIIYFGADINSLSFFIFSAFNIFLFLTIINFSNKMGVDNLVSNSILVSLLISCFGVIFLGGFTFLHSVSVEDGVERAVGFFNNPNQLGYFSVCTFSLLNLLFFVNKINFNKWILGIVLAIFLCIASLSKAAMVSLIVSLILLAMTLINKKNIYIYFFILVVVFLFIFRLGSLIDWSDLSFVKRLQAIGSDSDDSLAGRGYYALFEANTWEIFFGLGYEKTLKIVGHEVHSTYISILINYGLFGFLFFAIFQFIIFSKCYSRFGFTATIVLFLPTFLYGITHNGSRFSIFWLFLAFLYYFSNSDIYKINPKKPLGD